MSNSFSRILLPYALMITMTLSGCGEKSNCEHPTSHVHRYTKEITNDITITKYLEDESLTVHGYHWHEDYIEVTKEDEAVYKLLKSKSLFDGVTNWDYLYHLMSVKHDYLEFYYYYVTYETVVERNANGDIETHVEEEVHSGWTTDPYYSYNTGEIRVNHHRYYGYRIVYKDGKYKLEKSRAVDDIRDILYDYSYVSEDCTTIVCKDFNRSSYGLWQYTPEDFDAFTGPDLSNPNLDSGRTRMRNLKDPA